ncbi:MAG: WG repeat-containing protein [Moraxellaceae bacterium]|nr:WG repeat-containing protein [Moraxellaceae bacterium]
MKFSKSKLLLTVLLTSTFMTNAYSARCKIPKSYYKHVSCTSDKRYFLAKADSGQAVALINRAGKESADLMVYHKVLAHKMGEGLLPVMKNGKVGYINGQGHLIIPLKYDPFNGSNWARGFNNGRAVVKRNGRLGVIGTDNQIIVSFSSQIQGISDFSAGKATMRKRGKRVTIDINGQEIVQKPRPQPIEKQTKPQRKQAVAKKKPPVRQPTQATQKRKPVNRTVNREVTLSKERLNELLREYQDTPTNSVMQAPPPQAPIKQPPINDTDMPLFPDKSDGKWGFVDDKNVTMITYSFDEVTPFSQGLAGVRINDKWGFIDKAGELIVDFNYPNTGVIKSPTDKIKPFTFYKNTAWVGNLKDGTKLCIDTMGKNKPCLSDF